MDLPTSDSEALNSIHHLIPNNKLTHIYPHIVESSETAMKDQPYFKGNKYKLLISEDQADLHLPAVIACGMSIKPFYVPSQAFSGLFVRKVSR